MKTLKIFIGYDPKEAVAFHVLCHSLLERSSKPISITPIKNDKGREMQLPPLGRNR